MRRRDFFYDLPEELIAQRPLLCRKDSRLMIVPKDGRDLIHTQFPEIMGFLKKGDCLVFNDSRVIYARLWGIKETTGAKLEFLLVREHGKNLWESLVKPGKKARIGDCLYFGKDIYGEILDDTSSGGRIVKFNINDDIRGHLSAIGEIPLPPYIKEKLENPERYQTVYGKKEGSIAAPTAGLHFTDELLDDLKAMGVKIAFVTLHVGIGTFRPVKAEIIEEHRMHEEYYEIPQHTSEIISETINSGGRIIAVGTTTIRTLESSAKKKGGIMPDWGWTDIFIYPGYDFSVVDGLITNFHLPESTLIMLVSAFAGRERILDAYKEAVELRYRFFSFGDAMLII